MPLSIIDNHRDFPRVILALAKLNEQDDGNWSHIHPETPLFVMLTTMQYHNGLNGRLRSRQQMPTLKVMFYFIMGLQVESIPHHFPHCRQAQIV
jgi:hypothetical protein